MYRQLHWRSPSPEYDHDPLTAGRLEPVIYELNSRRPSTPPEASIDFSRSRNTADVIAFRESRPVPEQSLQINGGEDRKYHDDTPAMTPDSSRSSLVAPTEPARNRNAHGTSKTWVSPEAKIQGKWFALEPCLSRMYPDDKAGTKRCPYVPRTFKEYTEHLREFAEMMTKRQKKILEHKKKERAALGGKPLSRHALHRGETVKSDVDWALPFLGKIAEFGKSQQQNSDKLPKELTYDMEHDDAPNRSAVLGQPTIWCINHEIPERKAADWPTATERRWEGDQRVQSESGRYGRFLPLPRIQADASILWHQVPLSEPYPLDKVCRIPTVEDVWFPVDQIEAADVAALLNQDLLAAIDPLSDEY